MLRYRLCRVGLYHGVPTVGSHESGLRRSAASPISFPAVPLRLPLPRRMLASPADERLFRHPPSLSKQSPPAGAMRQHWAGCNILQVHLTRRALRGSRSLYLQEDPVLHGAGDCAASWLRHRGGAAAVLRAWHRLRALRSLYAVLARHGGDRSSRARGGGL